MFETLEDAKDLNIVPYFFYNIFVMTENSVYNWIFYLLMALSSGHADTHLAGLYSSSHNKNLIFIIITFKKPKCDITYQNTYIHSVN